MVPSNDWMGRYAHRSTQGAVAVAAITRTSTGVAAAAAQPLDLLLLERSEKFGGERSCSPRAT